MSQSRPFSSAQDKAAALPGWWPVALYAALLALSFSLCGLAYALFPELREVLVQEDALIENASLAFYFLGASLTALGLFNRAYRFRWMGALTALCLIGVLEEISYGQRIFPNLTFPTLPSGMTFDALHDSARIVVKGFESQGVPWYAGFLISAFVLLSVSLGLVAWLFRGEWGKLSAALTPRSAWLYVILGAALATCALFIDSQGFVPRKWAFLEEVLEMNAALSLAFAAGIGVFLTSQETPESKQQESNYDGEYNDQ